jgi:hypothetical protein
LKEEALDRTMWRAGFGRGFGPVVTQTTKWNEMKYGIKPGRNSAVVIATRYGSDGPEIQSSWGSTFSAPVQPNQPPIK